MYSFDQWKSMNGPVLMKWLLLRRPETLEKSLKSKVNGQNVSPHFFVRILRKKTKF